MADTNTTPSGLDFATVQNSYLNDPVLQRIIADPEIGPEVVKTIHKKITPLPEVAVEERISSKLTAQISELKNAVESLTKSLREKEIIEEENRKKEALKSYGISDEEIPEIEKIMIEKKIPSYETALEYYRMRNQTLVPRSQPNNPIQLDDNEMSRIWRNPKDVRTTILKAMQEFRSMNHNRRSL